MSDNLFVKIWRVIYPVILYFLLNLAVSFLAQTIIGMMPSELSVSERVNRNVAIISIAHMAISLIVFYIIYKKDYIVSSKQILKKPWLFVVLVLIGVLASHGLSTLVSFMNIDGIIGSYQSIENAIFSANAIPVVLQAVIFAPLAEELLFRGIVFNRLKEYTNFWVAAVVSSAIFGFYHFNLAQGIFAFIFGILLCFVYDRSRNLWSNVAIHFGGNLISVVLVYTGLTYPAIWIYVIVMIVCLALAGLLLRLLVNNLDTES